MKRILIIPAFTVAVMLFSYSNKKNPYQGPHIPAPAFNAVLFESLVNQKMKNTSKGYAFVIANKDGIMARSEGGWAQDPSDGNLRMTTKIPSCIGSVTKMLSVTALLNLLEAMPGVKLDDPVFSKLPKKWQEKYKNSRVECITYRDLLQHRSGFRKDDDVANLDSLGKLPKVCPDNIKRSYDNSNVSLLRYLITNLAYPKDGEAIEKKLASLSFTEYSEKANIEYSFPFERYLVNTVLEKGIVPIKASCRPEPDLMPAVAKGYDDRKDSEGVLTETEEGHKKKGNHCAPQGSWYLSAEMLAQFGRTLLFTNNYLTNTTKNMLFDPANEDSRLGWASIKRHDGFKKETGQAGWPWHDGAQSGTGYRAVIMQLPYGYVGTAVVNSPVYLKSENTEGLPGTTTVISDILMECFYEATHSGISTEIAKHGIPERSYQEEFSMIWNSGYYPVWVDAYSVNGKTFFNTIFRPNKSNYDVQVRHDMTTASYQQEYDTWVKKKGYRLQQLESYNDAGKLKFAAIFINKPERDRPQPAYHALSQEEHQQQFEKLSGEGYVPVNVSVVFVGDKKYYSAFYEKRNVGGHVLKSTLTQQEYQNLFEEMKKKGWEQVYINAYEHNNQTFFSVIWYEKSGYNEFTAVRRASSDVYQQQWQTNTGNGFLTRCVTGYEEGGKQWFAAHWSK